MCLFHNWQIITYSSHCVFIASWTRFRYEASSMYSSSRSTSSISANILSLAVERLPQALRWSFLSVGLIRKLLLIFQLNFSQQFPRNLHKMYTSLASQNPSVGHSTEHRSAILRGPGLV